MKIIVTGATGMVGEGVLLVALDQPAVTEVLVVGRRSIGRQHAKLRELILDDFAVIGDHASMLAGYDACFFCAGVSSIGENETSFTRKTYDFVVPFATALSRINTAMTFFKAVYNFRPGFMQPVQGQKNVRTIYRVFNAVGPIWYLLAPNWICTMKEVGLAMIHCVTRGYDKPVLAVKDIKQQAK